MSRLIEMFDCGHGHYSAHEHEFCQICPDSLKGKVESRWDEQPDGTFKRRDVAGGKP
jgi:hypothetical protein